MHKRISKSLLTNKGKLPPARCSQTWMNKNHPGLWDDIHAITDFLDKHTKISIRINTILAGITKKPSCATCGRLPSYDDTSGWRKFCSTKCAAQSATTQTKRTETISERHGTNRGVTMPNYTGWRSREMEIRDKIKEGISAIDLATHLGFKNTSGLYNYVLPFFNISSSDLSHNKTWSSQGEREVMKYIQSINQDIKVQSSVWGVIPNLEIDIWIPEMKIAIEFNGDYWHSTEKKETDYHLSKTKLAEQNDIHLIHIYEHEWRDKPEKVKQLLRGMFTDRQTIGARQTKNGVPTNDEPRSFFDQYHFDGHRGATEYYGLTFNDEWVMMASFTNGELIRLASSIRVVGGLSKIMKACPHREIFSFANRGRTKRNHNIYLASGFVETRTTASNYVYVKGSEKLSRQQAMKHKLPKLLGDGFDPILTERENMQTNKWLRIHDSGQLVYEWSQKRADPKAHPLILRVDG